MARSMKRREALLTFEAIQIEGGLLAPEWLARIARLEAPHQADADYRVPRGLNLRDEIGRFWRIAQAHYEDYAGGMRRGADRAALSERFVRALLDEVFRFNLQPAEPVLIAGRGYPIGLTARAGAVPVVIAPAPARQGDTTLDTPQMSFGDAGRRRTAFGLVQEVLNASPDMLWGVVCDGDRLRLVRDNASLTRPSWIEVDLLRIFSEDRFSDFTALWLLLHVSRFGAPGQPLTACPLEAWREAGRQEGTRALGHLRVGVKEALQALGTGFLSHPESRELRDALESGALTRQGYFQQLLRLVYRLIFLLTVEERALLHPEDTPDEIRALYADGYGLRRLRERSARRSAHDRHEDLWEATRVVLRGLDRGEPRLGLPALGGLFAARQCPALDAARLENRHLLAAVFQLSWMRDQGSLARVNWRDMGPEELGSVYESLLELEPEVSLSARTLRFAEGLAGNARKTTGSYYTPDSLVQVLLDAALEPVVRDTLAANPRRGAEALLELAIVDPACGSGHFLLGAARRLAAHVARATRDVTPSAADYRRALRQVVSRCIYGVDLNPMAIELCRVALWMEAVEPGLPLGFLDAHLRCGNALLGATPALMAQGVPDAAFEPIEGDDKKVASMLKKRNKKEAAGQGSLVAGWSDRVAEADEQLHAEMAAFEAAGDVDADALAAKEARWEALQAGDAHRRAHLAADAWCAAFVWPKPATAGPIVEVAPTTAVWRDLLAGRQPALLVETVRELAARYRFFHWHLAFPTVFARGGFDVVLGNPPWERVKLQEEEFFASRSPEIAGSANAAARKKRIAALPQTDPALWTEWAAESRVAEGQSQLVRSGGRYPLCGKGDINTYALFAEHNRVITGAHGRAGFIAPTGIATDDSTKEYFGALVSGGELAALYSFENEEKLFPGVDHRVRFTLLALSRAGGAVADLVFFARQVRDLADPERHFSLSGQDFMTLNPNTKTCPTFRSRRDADLNLALYRRAGILWREEGDGGNPWGLRFMAMLHMANDSGLFRTGGELAAEGWSLHGSRYVRGGQRLVPLVEAKMVHHFDHRFGTYEGQTEAGANQGKLPEFDEVAHGDACRVTLPRYWVDESVVLDTLQLKSWYIGWRKICRSTDQRTLICSLTPSYGAGDSYYVVRSKTDPRYVMALYASISSFILDYSSRQKVGGSNLVYHTFKQLPVLPPAAYDAPTPWSREEPVVDWLLPRVLELTYTAWDLEAFGRDVGYDGPPFRWVPARRARLRAELDAAFFHLYGLSRDDTDYILDTFPIVRKNDEKAHGEYRTKRLILECFDAMAEAVRTGVPYRTPLDPPPADPAVAHAASTRPAWAPPPTGGEVIRFPTPLPAPAVPGWEPPSWGPEIFDEAGQLAGARSRDGAWALADGDLLYGAIHAALWALREPALPDEVRRVVTAILWPGSVFSSLPKQDRGELRRLIGAADFARTGPVGGWLAEIRRLNSHKKLTFTGDRWCTEAEPLDEALKARALVARAWLNEQALSEEAESLMWRYIAG